MRTTIALMLVIAATPAMAQLYRWTDQSGKTHFTDTPPPASAKNVEKKRGGAAPGGDQPGAGQPFVLQQAMRDNPVTLYTTEGCEACGEARKVLNTRGVPFREVGVASEAQLSELKKAVGSNSVPAMLIGQNVVKGFETGQYNRALDDAGYPRAGILPARSQAEPAPATPAKSEPAAEQPAAAPKGPYAR